MPPRFRFQQPPEDLRRKPGSQPISGRDKKGPNYMASPRIVNHIEIWSIDRLIPYALNSRTHSKRQIAQIAASMQEHGVVNPILADANRHVIAGHGRILAARLIGLAQLPVIVLDHLTEAQARALRIADNKIAENAGWHDQNLCTELAALLEAKIDLTLLGFSDAELRRVLAELQYPTGLIDEDTVPEALKKPITVLGEEWVLGDHRLRCGDATLLEDVKLVMEGQKANLIFADCPYNVNYLGRRRSDAENLRILNDNLGANFYNFLYASCVAMLAVAAGAIYIVSVRASAGDYRFREAQAAGVSSASF
jgi:ParB-like chromosome segregation protein Spo0J